MRVAGGEGVMIVSADREDTETEYRIVVNIKRKELNEARGSLKLRVLAVQAFEGQLRRLVEEVE